MAAGPLVAAVAVAAVAAATEAATVADVEAVAADAEAVAATAAEQKEAETRAFAIRTSRLCTVCYKQCRFQSKC